MTHDGSGNALELGPSRSWRWSTMFQSCFIPSFFGGNGPIAVYWPQRLKICLRIKLQACLVASSSLSIKLGDLLKNTWRTSAWWTLPCAVAKVSKLCVAAQASNLSVMLTPHKVIEVPKTQMPKSPRLSNSSQLRKWIRNSIVRSQFRTKSKKANRSSRIKKRCPRMWKSPMSLLRLRKRRRRKNLNLATPKIRMLMSRSRKNRPQLKSPPQM